MSASAIPAFPDRDARLNAETPWRASACCAGPKPAPLTDMRGSSWRRFRSESVPWNVAAAMSVGVRCPRAIWISTRRSAGEQPVNSVRYWIFSETAIQSAYDGNRVAGVVWNVWSAA